MNLSTASIVKAPVRAARRELVQLSRAMGAPFGVQAALLRPRDLGPHLIQWLPLASITRWSDHEAWPAALRRGFVLAGDWDERLVGDLDYYLSKSRNYRSAVQVFEYGMAYRDSDQYLFLQDTMRRGGHHHDVVGRYGGGSPDAYFERLKRIFNDIARRGYLTQRQLGHSQDDEIKVVLDRHGRPVRVLGGNHRFAMARALGLERVPVQVVAVHRRWARAAWAAQGHDLVMALRVALDGLALG